MTMSAEDLFRRMRTRRALESLIGTPEDADFDCKQWNPRPEANRGSIAKAACGFANATGGVIIIGLKAASPGSGLPDVVQSLEPVPDRKAVASEALEIIHKLVEPGIEGIQVKTVPDGASKHSGFVLILVPSSGGAPRRTKTDWKFYVRVSSGTLPMEFFQIEDRFGRRPHPALSLHLQIENMVERSGYVNQPCRKLLFGLRNDGRGIAKFPGIRFSASPQLRNDEFGVDGNGGCGIPPRPSESGWIVYRGGVDDVIYPGETRIIGKLIQLADDEGEQRVPADQGPPTVYMVARRRWACKAIPLRYEIFAEETPIYVGTFSLPEDAIRT